jgi:hypothetical protein
MKYIFHTAQCGSSLLATLVGTVNYHTYSEPTWTHSLIRENLFPDSYAPFETETEKDYIVKLPSGLCCTAVLTIRPKVFLYRKFQDHIYRHLLKGEHWPDINYFFEYETKHCHLAIKKLKPRSDIEKIAFFWLNNVLWVTEAVNVKWVHADDLFLNVETTMNEICKFFAIKPVQNFDMVRYDVKVAGLKGSDLPLKLIDIPPERLVRRNIKNSVVLRPFRDAYPRVAETLKWVETQLNDETLEKLSPFIYD